MSAYAVSARGLASRRVPQGVLTPMNTLLFGSGEQGAWYDPADLSTLFQDTAGTTPVTAVEQAVALMLDKSGRGNHASQATSTKRPRYSRRVNLLTKTEQFDDAVWVVNTLAGSNCTKAANATVAPNGTLTADLITSTGLVNDFIYQVPPLASGRAVTLSLYVKNHDSTAMSVMARTSVTSLTAAINWTGSVLSSITLTTGTSASFVDVGSGWYRVSLSFTTGEVNQFMRIFPGTGTSVYLWGASLTLGIDSHLPYQWVNTDTDYDADPAKFPGYLRFDGVDDALQTGNIDFTGTDKMTVWAGFTKLSDAAAGIVCELSPNLSSNTGVFSLLAPVAGSTYGFYSKGASLAGAVSGLGRIAPHSSVITGIGDISGDRATLRELSVQTVQTTTDQGSGNYGNHPLYIGGRGGILSHFNGRLYGLIVRGAQSSLSQIEAAELYTRRRMMLP